MMCINLFQNPRMYRKIMQTFSTCGLCISKGSRKVISRCVLKKYFHTTNVQILQALCRLESRGVIQLSGKDTPEFLQGLVTNDVYLLTEKSPALQYCMMLNVQGRVLYDLFLYNITKPQDDGLRIVVDVDASAASELVKVFKKYKLRKKVDISDVSNCYKIWTQFDASDRTPSTDAIPVSGNILKFHDPRVPMFATRIISDQDSLDSGTEMATETDYRIHRYQWGIPEGVTDLPPGKCLPLESNLAYMSGVNFQKGCYVGQELTARTFHTGVIRKRLVPLILDTPGNIEPDTAITTQGKGKDAGKFRSSEGKFGLGLLRLERLEDSLEVLSKDGLAISLKATTPKWWPSTAS